MRARLKTQSRFIALTSAWIVPHLELRGVGEDADSVGENLRIELEVRAAGQIELGRLAALDDPDHHGGGRFSGNLLRHGIKPEVFIAPIELGHASLAPLDTNYARGVEERWGGWRDLDEEVMRVQVSPWFWSPAVFVAALAASVLVTAPGAAR